MHRDGAIAEAARHHGGRHGGHRSGGLLGVHQVDERQLLVKYSQKGKIGLLTPSDRRNNRHAGARSLHTAPHTEIPMHQTVDRAPPRKLSEIFNKEESALLTTRSDWMGWRAAVYVGRDRVDLCRAGAIP
jgi:hypothetical protein